MSAVPANIIVNFTANYNGTHRVCYRIGSSGSYTCVNTSCTVGPCSSSIPIFVDNETCINIDFNGYVQASCQDVSSSVDRVPFSVTFTPQPSCSQYTVTCLNSSVGSVVITNPGTSYVPGTPPAVIISGGGGSGATGTAIVGAGSLLTIASVDPGSGYNNGTFSAVHATGGTGSGAIFNVHTSSGIVQTVNIVSAGIGYRNTDVLGLTSADIGGSSPSVAAAIRITTDYGIIDSVTVNSAGTGYTSVPSITIASSSGVPATGVIVLNGCPSFTTDGCSGGVVTIPANILQIADVMTVCNVGGFTLGPQFGVSPSGNCLCNCVTATINVTGAVSTQVRYFYNKCGQGVISGLLTVGGSPSAIIDCIVPGSLVFQTLTTGTVGHVTLSGAC